MPISLTNRYTRFACFWACCAALCFSSPRACADDLTNDVARIADIMEAFGTGSIGFYSYPRGTTGLNLSRYLWAGLFEASGSDGTPNAGASYLRKIYLGMSPLADSVATNAEHVVRIEDILIARSYDETMWHAHLDNDQMSDLVRMLGYIDQSTYSGFNNLGYALDQILDYLPSLEQQPVDLSGIYDRLDSIDKFIQQTDQSAHQAADNGASSINYAVQQQDQEDTLAIGSTTPENMEGYFGEPEMPAYTPASDSDVADVDRDGLLDSLDADGPSHSPILTLISSSDFHSATGVSGSMQYNLAEGPVYSFVGDLSDISQASYYGLLAVFSALLFWRKQTEISAVVKGTNLSRV